MKFYVVSLNISGVLARSVALSACNAKGMQYKRHRELNPLLVEFLINLYHFQLGIRYKNELTLSHTKMTRHK